MELRFWKYEGAGNDFILVDGRKASSGAIKSNGQPTVEIPSELIRAMCDRHRGIGSDGLMILLEEPGYDFRMRYYNADGGEAAMCGNGARCITLFAHHLGIGNSEMTFMGRDGKHLARILSDNGESAIVETSIIDVTSYEYSEKTFFLNTGVPHYIEFVKDMDHIDVMKRGKEIRSNERFKSFGGTNVNFVEISKHGHIKIRTYERGVETETMACGTGAVASAIATHLYAQGDCNVFTVNVRGGNLDVSFATADNQSFTEIKLTGPARKVFEGIVSSSNLI